jgi:nitrite reductase/ring-hydroxylating ferredoxin subunit
MEHYVTDLKTLEEQKKMVVEVQYREILLLQTDSGIYAIMDKCPHRGVSLATGTVEEETIKCKDHGLKIRLDTGEVASERQADFLRLDKTSRRVTTYAVVIKDDKVYIDM